MGTLHMAIPFSHPQARTPNPGLPAKLLPTHKAPEDRGSIRSISTNRTPEQIAALEAEHALVRQCAAGDNRAWHQLVTTQHKRVYAICFRFTGSPTDAEDITQDVFLKVYRNLPAFDPAKGSFATWLTTLTRNLLVDNYRRTRLDRASDSLDETIGGEEDGPTAAERLADTGPSQETQYGRLELKAAVQAALARLSPELREAVILRDLEDMDYKEIAVVLKIPEGTVKSRISRGRAELARLLQRIPRSSYTAVHESGQVQ